MGLLGIDHIQLAMPEGQEEAARRFYGGLLGLSEVEKPENLKKRGCCWFEKDGIKVHLGVEKAFRPSLKAHPAFLVEDLAAFVARLEQAGVAARSDEPLSGYTRVYVDDPFGNRIELMEPIRSPPSASTSE
jgi:catechol 2,3-dioxygenase-like lactoylglutathione lyase family enzyme